VQHLKVEILFEDCFDVLRAHFERDHAREESSCSIIVGILDLLVNEHIPNISSLWVTSREVRNRTVSRRDLVSKSSKTSLPRS
jgi:hypothetical protein